MTETQIYLASNSPRRQQLLKQIGVCFEQVTVEILEQRESGEAPEKFVSRMALEKARAGRSSIANCTKPVLAADTALLLDGEVLGKPRDRQHGLEMMERLSGRSHEVLSSVALIFETEEIRIQKSRVRFRETTNVERIRYWDSGEPADKAGAYGIQGLGAVFISHLEGSYSGVMGLPLYETAQLLALFGISVVERLDGSRGVVHE